MIKPQGYHVWGTVSGQRVGLCLYKPPPGSYQPLCPQCSMIDPETRERVLVELVPSERFDQDAVEFDEE